MRYFSRFCLTVLKQVVYVSKSRRKETARAAQMLAEIEKQLGGTFTPATRRKIVVSYAIYNPMICDVFARLHGRSTTPAEKERLVHYFICSSLFDDFTDYGGITTDQLAAVSFTPEAYTAQSFDEKAFRQSHLLLKTFVKDKEAYLTIARRLFDAQLASQKQHRSALPDETIQEITFTKGGYAVLLCRHYLDIQASEAEEECWYRIGSIIQLTNDLYDIYKDLQDEIATLPNRMTNAYAFEQFFAAQVTQLKTQIAALPCPQGRKQTFSICLAGICAFGFVAIEQLKLLQGNALQLPELKQLERKQLIVDMEKKINRKRWFRFTYRYGKL